MDSEQLFQLHPDRVEEARCSILRRFVELGTPPGGMAKHAGFINLMVQYRGGYFETAKQQLVRDQFVEILQNGFLRLTLSGYQASCAL